MSELSDSSPKTPTISQFTPRDLSTPNKDYPSISKTVFTHVSNLHGLLNDWCQIRDKGVKLCRAIVALKLYECTDDYFPHQLQPLMLSLVEALESLKNIVSGVSILENQLQALSQLQTYNEPIILTWSAKQIYNTVAKIYASLQEELKLKEVITENIAHCRDENLIEVYNSSWELEPYFEPNSYLFAEVGLSAIT